jgi:EAL domain-containing protein (putative c-di-GMP-specific phosphodiesterase class I)
MGVLLAGILAERDIAFERERNVFALAGPQDHGRIVALLRQVLSEPERQAVSVLCGNSADFPRLQSLDNWWRVFETAWFEKALVADRFVTWFQPIVNTTEQRILAHECLIRLSAGRIYSGAEIVDAATIRNEIHAFDSHARRLAIRSAARQSPQGVYFVNFMPSSIYNPEYCMRTTMEALRESGMAPENIVFEVVESDLVKDPSHLRRICDYYKARGFGFALDDVGTGANSLQMVCDLKPNYIKLDKSLIQNVEQPMYAATIRKLVELADQFHVGVIAEGVERAHTKENLWLLGVQNMQGYLFGRPAPQIARPENDLVNLAGVLQTELLQTELPQTELPQTELPQTGLPQTGLLQISPGTEVPAMK